MAEDYGKKLYEALPPLYRREDAKIRPKPYPLKRFLQVAGTGFNFLAEKQEGHANMFDLYNTNSIFLPHLAEMMGYKFPYEMSEIEQRNFLKVLPDLYKYKGTSRVFDYLGQVVFGSTTRVHSDYRLNDDPKLPYYHVLDIYIEINGNLRDIGVRSERYRKFADTFRPLNTVINPIAQVYYTDEYFRNVNDDVMKNTIIYVKATDEYDRGRQSESSIIRLLNKDYESYNVGDNLNDNFFKGGSTLNKFQLNDSFVLNGSKYSTISHRDTIIIKPVTEVFSSVKLDNSGEDYAITIGGTLNSGVLNSNFVLNKASTRTKL